MFIIKIILKGLKLIRIKTTQLETKLKLKYPELTAQLFLEEEIEKIEILYLISKDVVEYFKDNRLNVGKFINGLNLDEISKRYVKNFIKRVFYMYNHSKWKLKNIFSYDEIIEKVKISDFLEKVKKYYFLPIEHFEIPVFYYDCGMKFLPTNVLKSLEGRDFIDGGAYIGDSALIFEKKYNPRQIHAFEPEYLNYNLMLKTIKRNQLSKVIPIKKGLGNMIKSLELNSQGVSSFISPSGDGDQKIEIISIDHYVQENNLSIGLIKLDIEGYEIEALKGAKNTISKFKPVLLIAIYHNGQQFFETYKLIQKYVPEYKFLIRKLNPLNPIAETCLIAWIQPSK